MVQRERVAAGFVLAVLADARATGAEASSSPSVPLGMEHLDNFRGTRPSKGSNVPSEVARQALG